VSGKEAFWRFRLAGIDLGIRAISGHVPGFTIKQALHTSAAGMTDSTSLGTVPVAYACHLSFL
jgi:hypothetical protein